MISFESPAAFVEWLMGQPPLRQRPLLKEHLNTFDTAEQDELTASLKKQADQYLRSNLDRCFQVAELLKDMAALTGNVLYKALALRAEGNGCAIGLGECQKGIDCYNEAAAIYQRHGRKLEEAWSQNGKIFALASMGRSDEAMAVGEWACRIFQELEAWLPLAEVTVNMAIIPGRLGQDEEALRLLDQARELYVLHGGDDIAKRLAVVDMNRSILLRNLGRFNGSPSPIVQIQEYLASALQSRDENFIIHHTSASPWI